MMKDKRVNREDVFETTTEINVQKSVQSRCKRFRDQLQAVNCIDDQKQKASSFTIFS